MSIRKTNEVTFNHLDTSLLSYVNSESRWEEFKQHLVKPLTIKRRSTVTGNIEYAGYPAAGNLLDSVCVESTFPGTAQHLLLISLIYHMNHVNRIPEMLTCLDVASHFTTTHYYSHFSTLVKQVTDINTRRRDDQLALVRIWDARIGDYIQAHSLKYDFMIDCHTNDSRLYNWQMADDYHSLTIDNYRHSAWSKHLTPLHYYAWMIPDSKLSKLDFYLDPNTSYMYSWLQDYLAKCRLYRVKINELAKAVRTRDSYRKKLDKLSQTFVKRNTSLSGEIRAVLERSTAQDSNDRKREAIQRQFLQQSSLLYNKFLKQINALTKK